MQPLKGLLTIEVEDWAGWRTCSRCGGRNRLVRGFVLLDGQRNALYIPELPERTKEHPKPRVSLAIAPLDPMADLAVRKRYAAMQAWLGRSSNFLRMAASSGGLPITGGREIRVKVVDRKDSPWASDSALYDQLMDRAEVLGHPRKVMFFAHAHLIALYDQRVCEYLAEWKRIRNGGRPQN